MHMDYYCTLLIVVLCIELVCNALKLNQLKFSIDAGALYPLLSDQNKLKTTPNRRLRNF